MDKISNERKAQIFYQGNGTQTQYSFPFDYLRKAFVHVSLISDEKIEELTQGTDYTVTDRVVTLAAPTGLKIKIYRQTATKPLVGWADASVLRAADMTVQSTQLLHLAEETSDLAQEGGLSKDGTDNIWDARYNKIKNLLDPTEPGDAVNLNYITKNQNSLLTQLRNTGDNQNTRLTTTGDTQNTRLVTTGNSYVSTMTTLRDTTAASATEAYNSAYSSASYVDTASSIAHAAKQLALASANSASSAATSASNAATSAAAAAQSAEAAKTFDPSSYYKKTETYTKTEVDNKISTIDLSPYALKTAIPTKTSQLTNDSGFITAADAPKVTESSGEATSNTSVVKGTGKLVWDRFGNIITLRVSGTIKDLSIGYGTAKLFSGLPKPKSEVAGLMAYGDDRYSATYPFTIDTNGNLWIPGSWEDYQTFAHPRSFIITYATKD